MKFMLTALLFGFSLLSYSTEIIKLESSDQLHFEINNCEQDEFGTIQFIDLNKISAVCKPLICFGEKISGQMDGMFRAKVFLGVMGSTTKKYYKEIEFYSLKNTFQDKINFELELKKIINDRICREAQYEEEMKGSSTRTIYIK